MPTREGWPREVEGARAEGSMRRSLVSESAGGGARDEVGDREVGEGRSEGNEAAEREMCCSAMRRKEMRLRMARSRNCVMTSAGRYLRVSLKPARRNKDDRVRVWQGQRESSSAMGCLGTAPGEGERSAPLARMGMLSRCSSTMFLMASQSKSLSARVLISGIWVKLKKAVE